MPPAKPVTDAGHAQTDDWDAGSRAFLRQKSTGAESRALAVGKAELGRCPGEQVGEKTFMRPGGACGRVDNLRHCNQTSWRDRSQLGSRDGRRPPKRKVPSLFGCA